VPASGPERISLARIVRHHGLRGEVGAEILTDFPEHLLSLTHVYLCDGRQVREEGVRSCRLTTNRGGQALFQFSNCNSIEEARALVGWHVQVQLSERLPLSQGRYYINDLEGCAVVEENGARIGAVASVQQTGKLQAGTPVLVVRAGEDEMLIPLAAEICISIDTAARKITVRLPEGLRELNGKSPARVENQ
jgi:16S rRNA processing protein RimM